jgi:hypothetical protein
MNEPMRTAIEVAGGEVMFQNLMRCMQLYGNFIKLTEEMTSTDYELKEVIDAIRKSKCLTYDICLGNTYFFKSFLYALPPKNKTNWLTTEFDIVRFEMNSKMFSVESILLTIM